MKSTCMGRYGVESHLSLPDMRKRISKTKSDNNIQLPTHLIDKYTIYRNKANSLMRNIKDELFKSWDGYDYYDKEYIKENLNLHYNNSEYPTIDHKISVFYGFINDIPLEEISHLDNLCITKRKINSAKCYRNETDFKT